MNTKIDVSTWKEVKITDLFEIKGGVRLTKSNWGEPIYNYIGASSMNNGVTGKCNQWNYENILSINYDGSIGYTFLQKHKVYVSDAVKVLIPKYIRTDNIDLFMCVVITKRLTLKYNYGKKLNTKRLSKESIYLPYKNDEIDWKWIEEFMSEVENDYKERLKNQPKYKTGKVDTSTWKSFNITDLFEVSKGKSKETKTGVPLVSCSANNNGKHLKKLSDNNLNDHIITLTSDGAPGVAFYQKEKVGVFSNVHILKLKNLRYTENIALFLCAVITKSFTPKYNYGKKLNVKRLSKEFIFLPEKNGEPDWEYMENFMNNLIEK